MAAVEVFDRLVDVKLVVLLNVDDVDTTQFDVFSNVTLVNPLQDWNAYLPMLVTLFGMIILVNPLHP